MTEEKIFETVLKRYKVLRLRSKISFYAMYYKMNVRELFHHIILKCYQEQVDEGTITKSGVFKDNCHPLFVLYVGKEFDVRNFKTGSIKLIELSPQDKIRKSKPCKHLRTLTAVERERERKDKLSDASAMLVKEKFRDLISQDRCADIFRDVKDHRERLPVSSKDWVKLKLKRFGLVNVL